MWLKDGSFKIFHRIISFEALLSVIYLRVYFYDMTFSMYMYLLDANILLHVLNLFSTGETGFTIALLKMQDVLLLLINCMTRKCSFFFGGGGINLMFTMIFPWSHSSFEIS